MPEREKYRCGEKGKAAANISNERKGEIERECKRLYERDRVRDRESFIKRVRDRESFRERVRESEKEK